MKLKEKEIRHKLAEKKANSVKFRAEIKSALGFDKLKIKGEKDKLMW